VSRIEKSALEKINNYLTSEGWFFILYSI
jgi:hypothetical protein